MRSASNDSDLLSFERFRTDILAGEAGHNGDPRLTRAVMNARMREARGGYFLVKDTPPAEIIRAIELVAAGESALSPAVTRRLIDRLSGDVDAERRNTDAAAQLEALIAR